MASPRSDDASTVIDNKGAGAAQTTTVLASSTPDSIEDQAEDKPLRGFARVFRSPLFNVIIVGLISFTQPGIWNALNSKPAWRSPTSPGALLTFDSP